MLIALGCSRGEELGRVSGKVTFEGEPVSSGIIIFANRAKGVYMTAALSADGNYRVVMARGVGLPLGEYQVAIGPPLPEESFGPPQRPLPKKMQFENIPVRYRKIETSPLQLEVRRGENPFNVDMIPE